MAREAKTTEKTDETTIDPQRSAELAALAGLDRKAEDVKVLDVRGLTSYADFIVLMTASSDRQVDAVADAVDDALRKAGVQPLGVEGIGAGNWTLIDTGDIVVHVFHRDSRGFYDLDGLWSDAPVLKVVDPAAKA